MRVEQAYTEWSATYDTDVNRTRDLDAEATRQVLEGRHPRSVVELGCGTGKNTVFLAEIAERVLAMDFSEGMLARAREKVASDRVIFAVADLTRRWPCEDRSADLIVGNLVLEHIEDLGFVFAEASRCLADGGELLVCELHPFRQYQGTQARFQRGQDTTPIPAFLHHVSDYADAAESAGLTLRRLNEWWHADDAGQPPRLISFLFGK